MTTNKARKRSGFPMTVLFSVLSLALFMIGCNAAEATAIAPFVGMKEQVRTMCARCSTAAKSKEAYRIGKVLVAYDTGEIDGWSMSTDYMDGLIATTPADVGTLVCVGEAEKEVDTSFKYGDGTLAYRVKRSVCDRLFYRGSPV